MIYIYIYIIILYHIIYISYYIYHYFISYNYNFAFCFILLSHCVSHSTKENSVCLCEERCWKFGIWGREGKQELKNSKIRKLVYSY